MTSGIFQASHVILRGSLEEGTMSLEEEKEAQGQDE